MEAATDVGKDEVEEEVMLLMLEMQLVLLLITKTRLSLIAYQCSHTTFQRVCLSVGKDEMTLADQIKPTLPSNWRQYSTSD